MWPKFSSYTGGRCSYYGGAKKVKVLFMGLSEINLYCYNLLLQFLYYRRGNKRLKTVLSMLPCDALERSNNTYKESIVGPCFSKNQKEIFAVRVWFSRESWKRPRQWKKVSMSKVEFVSLCVREKKNNSFEISVIILRYMRILYLFYSKRILKLQNFLQKASFFLYLRGLPKNGEGNKQRGRRKYTRKSN